MNNNGDSAGWRGFTLIEVLTVIAIIGILSAVILVSLSNSQKKGRDGRRVSDINQIRLALSLYYDAHNTYPSVSSGSTGSTVSSALTTGAFITTMPTDPSGGSTSYWYACTSISGSNCYAYALGANLETTNAVLSSGYTGSVAMFSSENCSSANPQGGFYLYCATN